MPAEVYYFADLEGLRPLVSAFGEEPAEVFMEALVHDKHWHPVPSQWNTNRYHAVRLSLFALRDLLTDAAHKGDDALVQEFMDGVNDGELLVGTLWARQGGDFIASLAIEVEGDTAWLRLIRTALDGGSMGGSRVAFPAYLERHPAHEEAHRDQPQSTHESIICREQIEDNNN